MTCNGSYNRLVKGLGAARIRHSVEGQAHMVKRPSGAARFKTKSGGLMPKERRYDIAAAQAIAIVLIVWSHIRGGGYWGSARIIAPLGCAMVVFFVFIAGYFNAAKSVTEPALFAKTRVRKLLVPLYGITLVYAAIVATFHGVGLPRGAVTLYGILVDPLVSGHGLSYNLPMWFIAPLFFAEVAYAFLGRIFNRGGACSRPVPDCRKPAGCALLGA